VVLYDDLGRGSNDDAYTWNHYGEPAFNTSKSVGALVAKGAVDAIYHGGDISYAIGYEAVWDFFLDMLVPVASGALYLTTVGNHESECHSPVCILDLEGLGLHLNNFSAYKSRWEMNNAGSGGVQNMWYSVRRGGVHFVSINTETDWHGAGEATMGDGHFPFLPAGGFGRARAFAVGRGALLPRPPARLAAPLPSWGATVTTLAPPALAAARRGASAPTSTPMPFPGAAEPPPAVLTLPGFAALAGALAQTRRRGGGTGAAGPAGMGQRGVLGRGAARPTPKLTTPEYPSNGLE
jgi:hypothetical protein